jgi:hypothetical protein
MLRIALIALISVVTVVFLLFIVGSVITKKDLALGTYAFILATGAAFFPAMIGSLIFYFLVRKIDKQTANFEEKLMVCVLFILICCAGQVIWAAVQWWAVGGRTLSDYLGRLREFAPWTLIIISMCTIMTALYFSRFLSSVK